MRNCRRTNPKAIPALVALTICFWAAAALAAGSIQEAVKSLVAQVKPGTAVAVAVIYEATDGDLTDLGNYWRDDVETAVTKQQLKVLARRDLVVVFDEQDPAREGGGLGVEVILTGRYYLPSSASGRAELQLRAIAVHNAQIMGAEKVMLDLPSSWARLQSHVLSNVFLKKVETVQPAGRNGPKLTAALDRKNPCYPAGAATSIAVETEPGVHLYILNLAADNTASLLLPNRFIKDQPLSGPTYNFPPLALAGRMQINLYPLKENETSQESMKVIASRKPLDFGFLPVPENAVFAGAKGGDLNRVRALLEKSTDWSEVTLQYMVGKDCH